MTWTLYEGDQEKIMPSTFSDEIFDAVITDPPFGIGFAYSQGKEEHNNPETYGKWIKKVYEEQLLRVLKPGGFLAIWQSQSYFKYFWDWFGDDIRIYAACRNWMLRGSGKTPIGRAYDPVIMLYKKGGPPKIPSGKRHSFDFSVANVARHIAKRETKDLGHPCPRPIDQVMEIVANFTIEQGLILDPFAGSGSIGEASERLNRNSVMIEIDPGYCKGIKEKMKKVELEENLRMLKNIELLKTRENIKLRRLINME